MGRRGKADGNDAAPVLARKGDGLVVWIVWWGDGAGLEGTKDCFDE